VRFPVAGALLSVVPVCGEQNPRRDAGAEAPGRRSPAIADGVSAIGTFNAARKGKEKGRKGRCEAVL